jgi:hypothetical protein
VWIREFIPEISLKIEAIEKEGQFLSGRRLPIERKRFHIRLEVGPSQQVLLEIGAVV